jgi:hypothetical protein
MGEILKEVYELQLDGVVTDLEMATERARAVLAGLKPTPP